jgi:hypothetical protein
MRKIIIAEGLLWEGKVGLNQNIINIFEADKIAQANDYMYVESLIRAHPENTTLFIDKELKIK